MASFTSLIARVLPTPGPGAWVGHGLELSLYLGLYLLYLGLRGLALGGEALALANTQRVIGWELALGLFREPAWQQWALVNAEPLVRLLNWVYILTYWPIILVSALPVYLWRRSTYYRYRNLILVHLALALTLFVLFPTAPPFKTAHLVDTIQLYGPTFYGSPEMARFYNTNAAMPSLHFSWTCILGVLILREVKGWYRLLGAAYPLLTLTAIVLTGNHFIADAVVGVALVGVAYGLARGWRRWRGRAKNRPPFHC